MEKIAAFVRINEMISVDFFYLAAAEIDVVCSYRTNRMENEHEIK